MLQTVVTCNAMQYLANKRQFVQDTDAWQTKRRFKTTVKFDNNLQGNDLHPHPLHSPTDREGVHLF